MEVQSHCELLTDGKQLNQIAIFFFFLIPQKNLKMGLIL